VAFAPVWVQVNGPAKVGDRLVVAAEGLADSAEIGPEPGVVGLGFERLAVESLGVVEGAEAMKSGCEEWNIGSRNHEPHPAQTFLASGQQLERMRPLVAKEKTEYVDIHIPGHEPTRVR
jgi:hypothetical protein